MDCSAVPLEQQNASSPQVAGTKRKASFSSESIPKRLHSGSGVQPLSTPATSPIYRCPTCQLRCWFCQTHNYPNRNIAASGNQSPEDVMPPQDTCSTMESEASRASSCKRRRDDGRTYMVAKDPDFADKVLLPCQVEVRYEMEENADLDTVFGKLPEIPSTAAFLSFDETLLKRIAKDLRQYERRADDENALAAICSDHFLIREAMQAPEDPVTIVSLRRDKWKPHKPGPILHSALYHYDWDVEPAATYAVSINQFEIRDRHLLKTPSFDRMLAEKEATCPYLSFEYKCNAKTGKRIHAVQQNTAASVIWLYQRRSMRWELELGLMDLRHYSIILMDGNFEVWEARCNGEGFFNQILAMGNLKMLRDLKEYVKWSNAIHTWGLGPNAASFKEDALKLLRRSLTPHRLEGVTQLGDGSAAAPPLQPPANSTQQPVIS